MNNFWDEYKKLEQEHDRAVRNIKALIDENKEEYYLMKTNEHIAAGQYSSISDFLSKVECEGMDYYYNCYCDVDVPNYSIFEDMIHYLEEHNN